MIDILIPVLGRPQNAIPIVDSIRGNSDCEHPIRFLCSPDDTEQIEACEETGAWLHVMDFPAGRNDYPKKMNAGLRLTGCPFMLLAADDLDFQPGWDTHVLQVAYDTNAGVIGTDDCANPSVQAGHFSTHPLVRRAYIAHQGGSLEGPGWLVSEQYDHNCCDVELCQLAQARGQWAFAPESKICHRHPGWGTADIDKTYLKGRRYFAKDQRLFRNRRRRWASRT